MPKKSTAWLTLACFVFVSTSCMTWGTRTIRATAPPPKQGAKVLSLVKASGATVVFSGSGPGRIAGSAVVGLAVGGAWERVEVQKPVGLVKKDAAGRVYEIVDRDGRAYPVGAIVSEDADRIVFFIVAAQPTTVSVPLSEIASIRVRKLSFVKTGLALVGLYGVGFIALWAIHGFDFE